MLALYMSTLTLRLITLVEIIPPPLLLDLVAIEDVALARALVLITLSLAVTILV